MMHKNPRLITFIQHALLSAGARGTAKLELLLNAATETLRLGLKHGNPCNPCNPEERRDSGWTHHDLPGICTHGPTPPTTGPPRLMKAGAVASVLDPNRRTYCVHLLSSRVISPFEQVHEIAHGPQQGPTTHIEHLHPVPDDTPQRTQDLWFRKPSKDGRTIAVNDSGDSVWNTMCLLDNRARENTRDRIRANALAQRAFENRSEQRDFSNRQAMAYAFPLARLAALQQLQYANSTQDSEEAGYRMQFTLGRISEVLDRAYNLARMRLAGVNLAADSPYHKYQHFYDRGMAPPSHEEMADVAISDLR